MTRFDPTAHPWPIALFWLSCASWLIFWLAAARARHATATDTDRGSRRFLVIALWTGVLLTFVAAWAVPSARIAGSGWPPLIVGLCLIWAGIGLRIWAIRTLGRFFRTVVAIQQDHRLVTDGPYRLIRHPSYAGSVMSVTGIGLALGNWLSVVIGLAFTLIGFARRITVEEDAMATRFGSDYTIYTRRTWRLFPPIW